MIIVWLLVVCWIIALVIFARHHKRLAKRFNLVRGLFVNALVYGALGIAVLTVSVQMAFRDDFNRSSVLVGALALLVTSVAAAVAGLLRLSQELGGTGNEPPQNPRS